MNSQEYKNKCQRLSDLYSVAAISGQPFEYQWKVGTWTEQTVACPDMHEELENWRVKPLPNPMKKYISLGLDMEFTNTSTFNTPILGKLKEVLSNGYISGGMSIKHCRLRANHIHWWNGKSEVNPIPNNCEYRTFWDEGEGWTNWEAKRFIYSWNDNNLLAFEIRYLEND